MDQHRALLGDASAYAICAFDVLGPDTAEPDAPVLKIVGPGFVAAVLNGNALCVTQQHNIALLPDDGIETIDFLPGVNDNVLDGFS